MASSSALRSNLQRIDGKGYKAYKDIQGEYSFNDFSVFVDYVQGDPFAGPSRVRIRVPQRKAGFPGELFRNRSPMTPLSLRKWQRRRNLLNSSLPNKKPANRKNSRNQDSDLECVLTISRMQFSY